MKQFRILVCGDRNWTDKRLIRERMCFYIDCNASTGDEVVVIEGEARGADILAREVAAELGFKVERFPANWNEFGKRAGPIRNNQMLKEGKPDFVLAFHGALQNSKGTKHMVSIARRHGVPVVVVEAK